MRGLLRTTATALLTIIALDRRFVDLNVHVREELDLAARAEVGGRGLLHWLLTSK